MVLEEMEKKWKESRSIRGFVNLLDVGGGEESSDCTKVCKMKTTSRMIVFH